MIYNASRAEEGERRKRPGFPLFPPSSLLHVLLRRRRNPHGTSAGLGSKVGVGGSIEGGGGGGW